MRERQRPRVTARLPSLAMIRGARRCCRPSLLGNAPSVPSGVPPPPPALVLLLHLLPYLLDSLAAAASWFGPLIAGVS